MSAQFGHCSKEKRYIYLKIYETHIKSVRRQNIVIFQNNSHIIYANLQYSVIQMKICTDIFKAQPSYFVDLLFCWTFEINWHNSYDFVGLGLEIRSTCISQGQSQVFSASNNTVFRGRIFAIKETFNVLSMRMHMCCGFLPKTRAIYGFQIDAIFDLAVYLVDIWLFFLRSLRWT